MALLEPFDGFCLGHALSKVCWYVTSNDKVFIGLPYTSVNVVQGAIQKYITCSKILEKESKHGAKLTLSLNWSLEN